MSNRSRLSESRTPNVDPPPYPTKTSAPTPSRHENPVCHPTPNSKTVPENKANEALEMERALRVSAEEETVRIQGMLDQSSRDCEMLRRALEGMSTSHAVLLGEPDGLQRGKSIFMWTVHVDGTLKTIRPDIGVNKGMHGACSVLHELFERIVVAVVSLMRTKKKKTMVNEEVNEAELEFAKQLERYTANHAVKAAIEIINATSPPTARRVGLAVFLTPVLEYLTAKLLGLSGKVTIELKENRLTLHSIRLAVSNDDELSKLLLEGDVNRSTGIFHLDGACPLRLVTCGRCGTVSDFSMWNVFVCRVLNDLHPGEGGDMSTKGMRVVNSFVNDMFERIAVEAACLTRINKKKTVSLCEIEEAVRLVLPAELTKHATLEGTKAITKAAQKVGKSDSSDLGLIFPVDRVYSLLHALHYTKHTDFSAAVYFTAVLEYLTEELLDLSVKAAIRLGKKCITLHHVTRAIHDDKELSKLCLDTYCHQKELPKASAKWAGKTTDAKKEFQVASLILNVLPCDVSTSGPEVPEHFVPYDFVLEELLAFLAPVVEPFPLSCSSVTCVDCFEVPVGSDNEPTCQNGHPLAEHTWEGEWVCTGCAEDFPGGHSMSCRECGVDFCATCFEEGSTIPCDNEHPWHRKWVCKGCEKEFRTEKVYLGTYWEVCQACYEDEEEWTSEEEEEEEEEEEACYEEEM